ncbi:hypothetical protein AXG93_1390s1130 [Marchantia polymorpha subsp. ruderalis]|uniref:mRNA (guanine-N(7))-methyltransferase n=1 Tax=Marchantia polymorpha subsp. ruderalis TaxID=1480154 RepID=A0A176W7T5_MARPO|nr:hypothetical protein AXG93_1390s1130 [Marchantia polymorpha subsp. ruderalis]
MAAHSWIPGNVVGWPPALSLHTRLLGFVRTVLLRQMVEPGNVVCDLFCGRGLDTERWAESGIGRYIGVDLSASALEEAREQWEQQEKPFPAHFCELDPCMVDLQDQLQDYGLPADVVCCFSHLQDCFTSEDMVRRLLKNVSAVLKSGGYFFGTCPDSSTIWYKYQKAVEGAIKAGVLRLSHLDGPLPCVRTDIYKISFEDDRFYSFGSKYFLRFSDDGLPPQPQILVHFPSLMRLAKEFDLECVELRNLNEFYEDLHGRFDAELRSSCGPRGYPVLDARGRLNAQALDVLSLYTTVVFRKTRPAPEFLPLSPQTEDCRKSLGAETTLSVYTRRKAEHVPEHTDAIIPIGIDSSKDDENEKPCEGGRQGSDSSETHTYVGADGVIWPDDVDECSGPSDVSRYAELGNPKSMYICFLAFQPILWRC